MDDAAAGQRGTRAIASAELERFLRAHWGVRPATAAPDLGGSSNLNLLVTDDRSLQVARVYRPFVTGPRVAVLQAVRRHLVSHGVPCAGPIPTLGGRGWETFCGRAVEVEPYVAAPAAMHTLARVRTGLAVLGRIHALLQAFPAGPAAAVPRFANHVAATGLVQAVAAGTRRIRAWRPTPAEARLADLADQLAETLAGWDLDCPVPIRRQLVHGDFWDDNVRFRHRQVALVTDFDFLGERPRTDDLALTLYYTSVDIADITSDPAQLAELVGAYEAGLGTRLPPDERAAIPRAMARQPLWSIAVWVALLDNQDTARRHLAATGAELTWALQLTGRIAQVQDALTNRLPAKASPPAGSHTNASAQQDRTPDQLPPHIGGDQVRWIGTDGRFDTGVVIAEVRWLSGARLIDVFAGPVPLMPGAAGAGNPIAVLPVRFHLLWRHILTAGLAARLTAGTLVGPGSGGSR